MRIPVVTATSESSPDPLAALPLLREAGVSVYWEPLEGRTAWVADVDTRQVWLSRAIPRDAVLHYLVQALQVLDDHAAPATTHRPDLRLVHSTDAAGSPAYRHPPVLQAVPDE